MTVLPNILAISFVTPAFMLAGLALASIPIIIHILNRRRYKTIPWAAMEFLLRAMKKNRRRLKFEQWLLLATRCLVLALIGLALARPLGCGDRALAIAGQRSGLHVFVIDNSYSMAYEADRPDARTHLDRAKNLVKEQIARLQPGGEQVALITAARPAGTVLSAPTYDLNAATAAVDKIEQSYGGTDLLGALKLAGDVAQREKQQPRKRLYLLTDGTRSAWQTAEANAIATVGQELAKVFHPITHYHLGRSDQWNQAALELRPEGNLVTAHSNDSFLATIQGFGSGPEALLQWKLDDAVLPGGSNIKIGPEAQKVPQSQVVFRDGGPHVITVNLNAADRLKVDNQRSRMINVASALRVLIVEGERGMGRLTGSGMSLQLALAPPKGADAPTSAPTQTATTSTTDSYVAPELISDLEFGNKVLTDYRAIILTAVGQIAPAQADQLALFVKQGGTLMIFMGEPVVGDSYNQVLLPRGLMPGPLTKRVNVAADQPGFTFDFKPNGLLHPLLHVFQGQENSGLGTAQVFTYWQMDIRPDAKAERVLNYQSADGKADTRVQQKDPAITLHGLGQGRVVVVTTTANWEWTSLPVKEGAYVALMHEMLAGSLSAGDAWMNPSVGESLQVPTNLKLTAVPTLTDPTQKEIVLEAVPAGGPVGYRSPPLQRPGVYRLITGNQSMPIAVNVPAEEADVRTIENGSIKKALGDIDVELLSDMLPTDMATANALGDDYGWPVMFLVLIFVAAECAMAMRFGHYRRT